MRGRTREIVVGLVIVAALALGGTALARATGAFEDEQELVGPQADRARAAALRATGGGTANAVERDSEDGATYEVEVTRKDGSTVDVRLDESFSVVVIESDSEDDADGDENE